MIVSIIVLACIAIVFFFVMKQKPKTQPESPAQSTSFVALNDKGEPMPSELLDLDSTTLAERQRAYGRGYTLQRRYDFVQRIAELSNDADTLEALRTNTYKGPLPELDEKGNPVVTFGGGVPDADVPVQQLRYFCIKDKGYHVSVWPKDQGIQNLDYLEFPIAGMTYRGDLSAYYGEHLGTLESEPTNPYDSSAIKILAEDGHHVGYVPKDYTHELRLRHQLPCSCYFYIGSNSDSLYSSCYVPNVLP